MEVADYGLGGRGCNAGCGDDCIDVRACWGERGLMNVSLR
jgi:hypothetical protein